MIEKLRFLRKWGYKEGDGEITLDLYWQLADNTGAKNGKDAFQSWFLPVFAQKCSVTKVNWKFL